MQQLLRRLATAAFLILFALGAQPVAAQAALPARTAQDVQQSLHLLETTAYREVNEQQLVDAARAALVEYARKHGVAVTVPALRDAGDETRTASELDGAIVSASVAAHGDATEYAYAAIGGMAAAFGDRYTEFMTPDQYRQFNAALDPERISGIGVLVEQDPDTSYIRLSYVLPNTPAERAGLHEGDLLISVDGASTKGLTIEGVSRLLRGKVGTVVNLQVAPSLRVTPRAIPITRSEVQPPTVVFKMLPNQIGYVYVLAFGRATPDEFNLALQRLQEQGARALVFDLRNDTGGYVDSAVYISSHFVGDQAILTVEARGDRATTYHSDSKLQIDLPTTVLVNGYTASASEITAGALQDDGAATLVGTRTFGKGVMQTLTELADGAAIKITTAHYLTPARRDINLRGIDPDLSVDENRDARFGELDHDAQLRAAVAYLQRKIAVAPR
ncbi:MAG TPA: S41 family peptidase [Candidatus Tyrphobacter sp.]